MKTKDNKTPSKLTNKDFAKFVIDANSSPFFIIFFILLFIYVQFTVFEGDISEAAIAVILGMCLIVMNLQRALLRQQQELVKSMFEILEEMIAKPRIAEKRTKRRGRPRKLAN
jgi:hypothetical protein